MKKILILALVIISTLACSRKQEIDDDTLAEIFREAYISNAYLGVKYFNIDSIQIYEPILKRYGYTPEDLRYTIGNFSRRKSAQLGTVLKKAEEQLAELAEDYTKRVEVLDTIREVAIRNLKRTVREDSVIYITKRADTAKLKMVISPLKPGSYSLRYKYEYNMPKELKGKYHQVDLSKQLRGKIYVETNDNNHKATYTYTLRPSETIRRTISADTASKSIVVIFGEYPDGKRKVKRPDITVRELLVVYTPDEQMAIDTLFRKYVDIPIFDDIFYPTAPDSLALSADTTRVAQ